MKSFKTSCCLRKFPPGKEALTHICWRMACSVSLAPRLIWLRKSVCLGCVTGSPVCRCKPHFTIMVTFLLPIGCLLWLSTSSGPGQDWSSLMGGGPPSTPAPGGLLKGESLAPVAAWQILSCCMRFSLCRSYC